MNSQVRVNRISVVSVPVRDQQVARQFYEQKLGFHLMRDTAMGDGGRWIELAPEDERTSITLVTWFPQMPPGSQQGLVLEVADVKSVHAGLQAAGVETSDIETAFWGTYCTLNDPDGNSLLIHQPVEG
jgi:catechol 2,3-dioxygenase-like lactoylglutathione lyase family enzyme